MTMVLIVNLQYRGVIIIRVTIKEKVMPRAENRETTKTIGQR